MGMRNLWQEYLPFSQFEKLSGLAVNIQKTSMFSSGLSQQLLDRIKMKFLLSSESLPIRYLGLPLCSKRLSVKDCDPLLSQIRRKLNGWLNRRLSIAGRLRLISTVISGNVGFWTSAFLLPKRVKQLINSLTTSFLWEGTLDNSNGAKVAWDAICFPKSEGGLGLRSISSWNSIYSLKLIWFLFFRSGSLWVAWCRHKYLSNGSFWSLNENNYTIPWTFRHLLRHRSQALPFLRITVGRGDDTFFWYDPWPSVGPLITFLGVSATAQLGIPLDSLVSDYIVDGSWNLPPARSDLQLEAMASISAVVPSAQQGTVPWVIGSTTHSRFSSKILLNAIRPRKQPLIGANLVWHTALIPKHSTNAWLFILNRNPTLMRAKSWNSDIETTCLLCGLSEESRDHLFFECTYSWTCWSKCTQKLGLNTVPRNWDQVIHWILSLPKRSPSTVAIYQVWAAVLYEVWKERNRRSHEGITLTEVVLIQNILRLVKDKSIALFNTGHSIGADLHQFWSSRP